MMVDLGMRATRPAVHDDDQVDSLLAGRTQGLVWPSRSQRGAPAGTIFFGGGMPDPAQYPLGAFTELLPEVLRDDDAAAMTYVPEPGYGGLRDVVAARHAERDGVAVDSTQVTVTNASAGALVLAANAFLEPGDVVVVDRLTYHGAVLTFRLAGATVIGAPLDDHGLRADTLEDLLTELQAAGRRVKLVYTIPGCQSPTGRLMPDGRRREIAELARRFGVVVLYDDTYGELRYDDGFPPSLLAYAPERTVHLGSFSKTIGPGLRVGWTAAPANITSAFTAIRTDLGTTPITQRLVARFIERGYYDAHLDKVNAFYRDKRDAMVAALEEHCAPYCTWHVPPGGFFIWLDFPGDTVPELEDFALDERVAFFGGHHFSVDEPERSGLRLAFGQLPVEDLREGIRRLGRAMAAQAASGGT
jgi:2-aminoadipate transaminase